MECLVRTLFDWLYSPAIERQVEMVQPQVPQKPNLTENSPANLTELIDVAFMTS